MKLFKKLMAVALAGAMALMVLTGCGGALNKADLIELLNDFTQGKITFTDAGAKQADAVIELLQTKYDQASEEEKKTFDPREVLFSETANETEVKKELRGALGISETEKDTYSIGVGQVKNYNSKYAKENQTALLYISMIKSGRNTITLYGCDMVSDHATISVDYVTFGDAEYFVIVQRHIA